MDKSKQIAEGLEREIKSFYDDFESVLSIDSDIMITAKKLINRSREYKSPSFLMLVVGPVKSGKSTLVNLFANYKVCPTDFLECTVRPSLISSTKADEELAIYSSVSNDASAITPTENIPNHDDKIELIFDNVKGLIGEGSITGVKKNILPFTPENLREYVAVNSVTTVHEDIILTSIKTKGGLLLRDNCYIIDMAGFDGARSNLANAGYGKIVERADLVVFVQSSNSALSKVSGEFFDLIKSKNPTVPICLIQNIFKSAYWRSEDKIIADIAEQRNHAITVIAAAGLSINPQHAYNLNLGMVTAVRDNDYLLEFKDELKAESDEFDRVQKELYQFIISNREAIRINNSNNRTIAVKNQLITRLKKLSQDRVNLLSKYNQIKSEFDALLKKDIILYIDTTSALDNASRDIIAEISDCYCQTQAILSGSILNDDVIFHDGLNLKYTTEEAREKIRLFFAAVHKIIQSQYNHIWFSLNYGETNESINNLNISMNRLFAKYDLGTESISLDNSNDVTLPDIIMPEFDYEHIIKYKILGFKHSTREMLTYLALANSLLMNKNSKDGTVSSTFLTREILPKFRLALDLTITSKLELVKSHAIQTITDKRDQAISQIIPNVDSFITENERLNQAIQKLETFIN